MSWPHLLSLSRVLASPVVAALILARPGDAFLWAGIIFGLASITDLLDGKLARYSRRASPFGVFLDTTSDKVLVALTLVAMAIAGLAPAWIALVILGREFLITGLRSYAAACNVIISPRSVGKGKAAITMVAIVLVLLAADGFHRGYLAALTSHAIWNDTFTASVWFLGFGAVLTLISGIAYVADAWPLLQNAPEVGELEPETPRRMAAGGDR